MRPRRPPIRDGHSLHRLNRADYANAIHDVLALTWMPPRSPPDDSAYGFEMFPTSWAYSPSLHERYLTAAGKCGALAVGDPDVAPGGELS